MKPSLRFLPPLLGAVACAAFGHDTWVQANTPVVRSGDAIYLSLLLGNHGNSHRDFKIAGKPSLEGSTVEVVAPDGSSFDLKPSLVDRGYAPKEGYWTARFEPVKPGLYLVDQASEQVVGYAPERVVRCAKTFFLVSAHLDRVPSDAPGYDRVLGRPLELVPLANPVAPMGPGTPIQVKLLFQGKPLAGEKVSFIPMGETLSAGFDPRYERKTDANGAASFEPKEANDYLIVSHHFVPVAGDPKVKTINYTATLTVIVPAVCPCCGE